MPKPLFIDFDKGINSLNVDSIAAPTDWQDFLVLLKEVLASDYKTIVIDTIDPLEDLAADHVCESGKKKSLTDFGFGAGYEILANEWRGMLSALERSGKPVCLLAHSIVRTANDPTLGAYDQYVPQLQKKTWAATHRWADLIGFAAFDAAKVGDERRAIVTGERVLHTVTGSGFVAKNRWSMPAKMPLSWPAIWDAMRPLSADQLRALIAGEAGPHAEKAATYVATAGDDVAKLRMILQALRDK